MAEAAYAFAVTGYAGHEEEILAMRNRNRPVKKTRAYLDWRYLGEKSGTAPQIFWMKDGTGETVAMAALIYRPYFVRGVRQEIAVLGDVSVDERHRGEGLATQLFQFMNRQLRERGCPGFVMPNEGAQRALAAADWQRVGQLVPRVCALEPIEKFKKAFKVVGLARLASSLWRFITRQLVGFQDKTGFTFEPVTQADAELQTFWEAFPKGQVILHDRSAGALRWRYLEQPQAAYRLGKFRRNGQLAGYVVWNVFPENGMCLLSDLLVLDPAWVRPCLGRFVEHLLPDKTVATVRAVLPEDYEGGQGLWRLGFLERSPIVPLQVYNVTDSFLEQPENWFVTPGDKDA